MNPNEEYTPQELEEAFRAAIAELKQGQTEADLEKVETALQKLANYEAYANQRLAEIKQNYAPLLKALKTLEEHADYRLQEYRSRN